MRVILSSYHSQMQHLTELSNIAQPWSLPLKHWLDASSGSLLSNTVVHGGNQPTTQTRGTIVKTTQTTKMRKKSRSNAQTSGTSSDSCGIQSFSRYSEYYKNYQYNQGRVFGGVPLRLPVSFHSTLRVFTKRAKTIYLIYISRRTCAACQVATMSDRRL